MISGPKGLLALRALLVLLACGRGEGGRDCGKFESG